MINNALRQQKEFPEYQEFKSKNVMNKITGLLFIFVAFCGFSSAQTKSLIVKYLPDGESIQERVVRLDFVDGKLVSQKPILEIKDDENYIIGLIRDRYISIYKIGSENEQKFLDLKTEQYVEKDTLPKLTKNQENWRKHFSPDEKKYIEFDRYPQQVEKLVIRIEGKNDLIIQESFSASVSSKSSVIPGLPLKWIDNERLLTQKENGKLVIVNLDGKMNYFPDIPCTKDDFPRFKETRIHKFIYVCSSKEFALDVDKLSFEKVKNDLDYGFSTKTIDKKSAYYYQDNLIGEDGIDDSTTDGYLALTYGKAGKYGFFDVNDINILKVWNQHTNEWQTFNFDGSHLELLGWYQEK